MSKNKLDMIKIMKRLQENSSNYKLEKYLRDVGVSFYEPGLIKDSSVNLIAIGGIPVTKLDMQDIAESTKLFMGVASSQSYLSYSDNAYEKIVIGLGHSSSAHMVTVSILVSGISCAVENEFNSQRDLIHLSRITEARTSVQDEPPYVVLDEEVLDDFRIMRNHAIQLREKYGKLKRNDRLEAINLLHSKASATSFILTGSLRNIQKLLGGITDDGKEVEYRSTLIKIKSVVSVYWEELFL